MVTETRLIELKFVNGSNPKESASRENRLSWTSLTVVFLDSISKICVVHFHFRSHRHCKGNDGPVRWRERGSLTMSVVQSGHSEKVDRREKPLCSLMWMSLVFSRYWNHRSFRNVNLRQTSTLNSLAFRTHFCHGAGTRFGALFLRSRTDRIDVSFGENDRFLPEMRRHVCIVR